MRSLSIISRQFDLFLWSSIDHYPPVCSLLKWKRTKKPNEKDTHNIEWQERRLYRNTSFVRYKTAWVELSLEAILQLLRIARSSLWCTLNRRTTARPSLWVFRQSKKLWTWPGLYSKFAYLLMMIAPTRKLLHLAAKIQTYWSDSTGSYSYSLLLHEVLSSLLINELFIDKHWAYVAATSWT